MAVRLGDSPQPPSPIPQPPQPEQPGAPQVRAPMVYVYEQQEWEYKVVGREADQTTPSEQELNALGRSGWEMVGVVAVAGGVQFYFKRLRK